MQDEWQTLCAWETSQILADKGRVAACCGLAATFYVREGHTEANRTAALECFNEYDRLCGSSLQWCRASAESNRLGRTAKLRSRDMSPYLLSPKWDLPEAEDRACAYYWHGGKRQHDASPFKINYFASPKMYVEVDDSLSFFQVSFPVLWFREREADFIDFVASCAERLRPLNGYGGITILTSTDRGDTQRAAPKIAGWAERYPGLEVDRPMSHKAVVHQKIKGGNWLTVLSTPFVEALGGEAALREELPEPLRLRKYGGGVILVAGSAPEVGDRNRDQDTPAYRTLARVLRPIRIVDHPRVYPEGRFSEEGAFAEWLARFDEQPGG